MAFERRSPATEIESKSDSWNVADGFTKLKILKPLVEMDKLVKIAIYGSETIEEAMEVAQFPDIKTMLRIEAIYRLIDTLRETIENSRFACKKEDKAVLDRLEQQVFDVKNVLSVIASEKVDMRTDRKQVVIDEEHFSVCIEELRKIKKELPEPLNKSSLIFPSSEEINLDDIKNQIIEGG
jgi:replicative DNA helicase